MKFFAFLSKKIDASVILSVCIFSCLFFPFVHTLPYLDGETEFIQSYEFYTEGFHGFLQTLHSTHPPLKLILNAIFFKLFGISSITYNISGYILGVLAIVAIFLLTRYMFTPWVARLTVILFSFTPTWISESLFTMREFMLVTFLLLSLYFYCKGKYFFYALCITIGVLTKETMLIIPIVTICVEFLFVMKKVHQKKRYRLIIPFVWSLIPIGIFCGWLILLNYYHVSAWQDWLFTPTAYHGTFYTVIYNVITFQILNPYTIEQWKHLFVLNFNWVYWIIIFIGLLLSIYHKYPSNLKIFQGQQVTKTFLIIILFCFTYCYLALSIQTYTITRYILPIIPFMLMGTVCGIYLVTKRWPMKGLFLQGFIIYVGIISLVSSVDPLSRLVWGKTYIFNNQFYLVDNSLGGPDALEYNLQFLMLARERSEIIEKQKTFSYPRFNCYWLKINRYDTVPNMLHMKLSIPPQCTSGLRAF